MARASTLNILVTGGAGFIGSNLCDRLIQRGHRVICLDNLLTGRLSNIRPLMNHPRFEFIVRPLQQVFGPSSMQEEKQGQPYRRQAEQPTGDTHPQWYSIERGLQHDIGHIDRGANDRRDQGAFPIGQEKGQDDEPTVEHRIPSS